MKVNGFTIMELIVGLIISSVAVSIIYYGYQSVLLQHKQITGARLRILKESQLLHALRKDIQASYAIAGDQNTLNCHTPETMVAYQTSEIGILRSVSGMTDTFPMTDCQWIFYDHDGWQTTDSSLIDSIVLQRSEERVTANYGWKRRAAASLYLNQYGS